MTFASLILNLPGENVTDLALMRIESERAKDQLAIQVLRAAAFVISDEESFKLAEHYIKEVKAIADALESKRDEFIKPAQAIIKAARADVKPRVDTAGQIEQILKSKCLEYRANVARLRAEAEAEAQRLLNSLAPPEEKRAALVVVAETVAPVTSGVSYPKRWVATVIDLSKVPEKYFVRQLSQTAIDLDVANGVREIEGVKIEQVETMSVNYRR